jgi:serine/threonine protein kinase
MKSNQPWASGPAEILSFAIKLISDSSDTNRRLSFILIDNSVEQMLRSFLSLPQRISGIKIPRKRIEESFESFPSLLDLLEEFAFDKVKEIDLVLIEWYHRLRNQLYHQGKGLTVEQDKIEVYSELAKSLLRKLFDTDIKEQSSNKSELLGEFIDIYNRLESTLIQLAARHSATGIYETSLLNAINYLRSGNILDNKSIKNIDRFRKIRNAIVHGQENYKKILDLNLLKEIKDFLKGLEEILDIKSE